MKNFSLIFLSQFSKLITGLLLFKLISINLGPDGLNDYGNLLNAMSILAIIAGGGVTNATIKYIAEYKNSYKRVIYYLSSVIVYNVAFFLMFFIFLMIFRTEVISFLFDDTVFSNLYFLIFILSTLLIGFINIGIGVINGYGKTSAFSIVQLTSNLIAITAFIVSFSFLDADKAAILCIFVFYTSYFFPIFLISKRFRPIFLVSLFKVKKEYFFKLPPFTVMAVVGCISFPLTEVIIREKISVTLGGDEAGLWMAVIRLSTSIVGLISVYLVFVMVPKISSAESKEEINKIVNSNMLNIATLLSITLFLIYEFRLEVIEIIYSQEFFRMETSLKYQFVGDFFRTISYIYTIIVVAKSKAKLYVISEFCQGLGLIFFSFLSMSWNPSIISVSQSYALTYIIFFILVYYIYCKSDFKKGNKKDDSGKIS